MSEIKIFIPWWMIPLGYVIFKMSMGVFLQKFYLRLHEGCLDFRPWRFFLFSVLTQPEVTILKVIFLPLIILVGFMIYGRKEVSWTGLLPAIIQDHLEKKEED